MTNPFDSGPDERLGALLRAHLDAPGHAQFVARVRRALARPAPDTSWDVLADWVRPGLAAAAALALAVALWIGLGVPADAEAFSLADAVQSTGVPETLLAGADGASTDAMLAAIVGER
jgi:hypothetical protein